MKEFVLCGCSGANIAIVKDCVKNQIHPLSWKKWMKCDLCSVQVSTRWNCVFKCRFSAAIKVYQITLQMACVMLVISANRESVSCNTFPPPHPQQQEQHNMLHQYNLNINFSHHFGLY